jgi:plastocyanin
VTFSANSVAGDAASIEDAGGNNQTGAVSTQLPAPVQAKVTDQFGNGVPDVAVGWTATGGTVSAATVSSDASGISAVNVTAGDTPGPITIMATAAALAGSPVTFSATATTAPTTAGVTIANNSFSPAALTVAAGTTVIWTWTAGAANHNVNPVGSEPTRSGNPTNGPHTYQFKFNTPGTYVYYCEVHGTPTGGMRGTVTVQ